MTSQPQDAPDREIVQRLPPAEPPPRFNHPEHLGKEGSPIVDVIDSAGINAHLVERRVGKRQTRCIPLKETDRSRGGPLRAALSMESDTSTPFRSSCDPSACGRPPHGHSDLGHGAEPVLNSRVGEGPGRGSCCSPACVGRGGLKVCGRDDRSTCWAFTWRTVPAAKGVYRSRRWRSGSVPEIETSSLRPASGPHPSRGIAAARAWVRPAVPGAHRPSPFGLPLPVHAPHGSKFGEPPLRGPRSSHLPSHFSACLGHPIDG